MSIKLIAVDIDGTLVNSQKEITPEVFSAIQDAKEAGVKVVIATGRPIAGVAKLLDDLQLRDQGDYVVTFNGALVQETATGHEIISESLTYEDYLDMEFLSRKLGVHMHAITKDGIYTANRNIGKYTVHESTLVSMPIFYRTPEEMAGKEIVKCMFIDEPEILDAAIEKIPAEFYERYSINKSAPFYLELLTKNVDKGSAITHLAEKLGLTKKDGIYTANRNIGKYTVHESTLVSMPIFYRTPEEMAGKEIVKCMFIDEPEILDAAIEKIPAEFYERYSINKSAPFYLELLTKNVDKGSAITHLAEKLGLTKDETMAIGDEENDRAMLEVVGNPVVMENGNPEIKKIAKYITKTNDESGVAHAIRTWVL
ncbi:hydrolase [Streptococcus pneumoniae]|nr:hydrolase [Streptococcus pneumoniae]